MTKQLNQFPYKYDNYGRYIIPHFINYDSIIAVDIGSHIGGFIDRYHNSFDLIHYYEMNPFAFKIIQNNHSNKSHIIGFNEAVSDYVGEADILYHPNDDAGSLCIDNPNQEVKEWGSKIATTQTITLDTVLERVGGKIHFLKMDCETSEYAILMNQDLSNIHYLSMELHHQLGIENWNQLVSHILKYFDFYGPLYSNLNYQNGLNKELNFVNKKHKHNIV